MNSHKTVGDNIKKDLQKIESEIKKWFENKGYLATVLVLADEIVINISGKICDDDVLRFNNDFDCKLQYKVITGEDLKNKGGKQLAHIDYENFKIEKYSFTPIFIKKYCDKIQKYIDDNEIGGYLGLFQNSIILDCPDFLSDEQIRKLENEFNLECGNVELLSDLKIGVYDFQML